MSKSLLCVYVRFFLKVTLEVLDAVHTSLCVRVKNGVYASIFLYNV